MSGYDGTVLKTSLSKDDEGELQDALPGSETAAHSRPNLGRMEQAMTAEDAPMAGPDCSRKPAVGTGWAVTQRLADELARRGGVARQRMAAVRGTVAIGVTSPLVNLLAKSAWARQRPDRAGAGGPVGRNVRMPASASFPSGHAASGFAFAAAVGRDEPWLGSALRLLAVAVAYSRVHTGVHYPGDAVAGALIGASAGQAVTDLIDRRPWTRRQ